MYGESFGAGCFAWVSGPCCHRLSPLCLTSPGSSPVQTAFFPAPIRARNPNEGGKGSRKWVAFPLSCSTYKYLAYAGRETKYFLGSTLCLSAKRKALEKISASRMLRSFLRFLTSAETVKRGEVFKSQERNSPSLFSRPRLLSGLCAQANPGGRKEGEGKSMDGSFLSHVALKKLRGHRPSFQTRAHSCILLQEIFVSKEPIAKLGKHCVRGKRNPFRCG